MPNTVRDALRLARDEGWYETKGLGSSHRQLKHLEKPGKVTISGHPKDDIPPKTWNSILKQLGLR